MVRKKKKNKTGLISHGPIFEITSAFFFFFKMRIGLCKNLKRVDLGGVHVSFDLN